MSVEPANRPIGRSSWWLLAAALLCMTSEPLHAQQGATLSGTVIDASTRTPVADVMISVQGTGRGAVSDGQGRFSIAGLAVGNHTIQAQRLGYAPLSRSVEITGPGSGATRLDLALTPSAQVITPLVVSATREAQRRSEGSATIDVIDGASVREARAAHPAEIARRVPGVYVSQLSGEGHSTAIRQPITTKPMYLFLEDGVPTRSTGFFNHNALYEVNLPQSGGMEVLKGPGTALYGSDAIGGVINVLTRPAPVTPTAEIALEGGAFGYRRMLATGGLTAGAHGLRADLNITSADGFKDNPYTRRSATVRHDAWTSSGFTFRTVLTGTTVAQNDVLAINRVTFDARPGLNLSPLAFREVVALRWSTAVERDFGTSLLSLTPYARHNVLKILPSWQLSFDPEVWDSRNDSYGLLMKYRRDFAPLRARVIIGADVDYSPGSVENNGIVARRNGADSIWSTFTVGAAHYDYDVTYRQLSPYLHTEFSPLPGVRLDVGMRYDHSGYSYTSNLTSLQTGRWRRPADTSLTFSRWSPKAGATIDLTPTLNLYGSYRQGFRAPGQSQLFQQGSSANSTALRPVTANSAEIGVRGTTAGRVAWQLSAYDMRIHDDILGVLDAQGIRTVSNVGETQHRGLELGVGAALTPTLRVDAAYSAGTQTYERWSFVAGTRNVDYSGKTIEAAPSTLGNLLVTWNAPLLRGGRVAAEWSHTGSYYTDPENLHDYGGHRLLTLHGNYKLGTVTEIFARLTNVSDAQYAELASYNAAQKDQFTPGAPRTLYAGMRYNWQSAGER